MSQAVEIAADNRRTILAAGTLAASSGIYLATKSGWGRVVAPAVWVTDYAVNGTKPDGVKVGMYSLSFLGPLGAFVGGVGAVLKGAVDDRTAELLEQVRASEPAHKRAGIHPVKVFKSCQDEIAAQLVASYGSTAWQHPNGLWVFIVDAGERFVCDHQPAAARTIYRPVIPLRSTSAGRVMTTMVRNG